MCNLIAINLLNIIVIFGSDSSAGIATELQAGRLVDRISVGTRFSAPVQTGTGAQSAFCTVGTGFSLGERSGRGVGLNTQHLLVPWSRKSKATNPLPLWAVRPVQSLSACKTVHFNFTYPSNLPMDRRACTEPQCLYNGALYLYLYLYSPYKPYGLYIASVPVQRCALPLPIHPVPFSTVRSVQSFSACTTVHFTFTYTSTPPMDPTACTQPQCLYNGAL